ncbi:MAG: aminotransferase class IV [Mariniphaga sp.]|nr:aminotransferase class IV [Mariniphaga sp.]
MAARFIIINNEIKDTHENLNLSSIYLKETFRLEEKIWFCNGKIPLYEENIFSLCEQAEIISYNIPEILNNKNEIRRLIQRIINKNKAFLSGLINVSIIFQEKKSDLIISLIPSENNHFELKNQSLLLSFSKCIKFSGNEFNCFRFYNSAFWKTVQFDASKSKVDGFIILNEKGGIVEYPESNIYFIKDKVLCTPSLETGCYLDPIREKILEAATILDLKIVETNKLNQDIISDMDEAFIAGESIAMQKIMGIGNKRFTHRTTILINKKLNEILLEN